MKHLFVAPEDIGRRDPVANRRLVAMARALERHAGVPARAVILDVGEPVAGTRPGAGGPSLEAVTARELEDGDEFCWFLSDAAGRYPAVAGRVGERMAAIAWCPESGRGQAGAHRWTSLPTSRVLFPTRHDLERAERRHGRLPHAAVAASGIDEEWLRQPRSAPGWVPEGVSLVLLVAHGAEELDRARQWALAWGRRRPDPAALVVLGGGEDAAPIEELGPRVLATAGAPLDVCAALLGAAAVVCDFGPPGTFPEMLVSAWLLGRATVADSAFGARRWCPAESGTLLVSSFPEVLGALDCLLEDSQGRAALGERSRRHAEERYSLEALGRRLSDACRRWGVDPGGAGRGRAVAHARRPVRPAIHQLVAEYREGDATGNHARALQEEFWRRGRESVIFAERYAAGAAGRCRSLEALAGAVEDTDVVLYHHAIQSSATDLYLRAGARRAMIYHNITPPEYFAGTLPRLERLAREGRECLPELARLSEVVMADSAFNAAELGSAGARRCAVVPILFQRLTLRVAETVPQARLGDGGARILFVGRITRNKCQHDLVRALSAYREFNPTARLVLVGSSIDDPGYAAEVRDLVDQLGLGGAVEMAGSVGDAELATRYRAADVFVCLSEHEGFCMPIVEAMEAGVPVIAYAAGAVPETLDGSGCLLHDKAPAVVATAIDRVVREPALRATIVARQRERLERFRPEQVAARVWEQLAPLLSEASA